MDSVFTQLDREWIALIRRPAFQALPKIYRYGKNPVITISDTSDWYAARIVSPACITISRKDATTPSSRIETCGVPHRGWTRAKAFGNR